MRVRLLELSTGFAIFFTMFGLSCSEAPPREELVVQTGAVSASDVLGFETASDWTVVQGTGTLASSTVHSQGARSLSLTNPRPNPFVVLQSSALANTQIGTTTSTLGFDILLPVFQQNPFWKGAVQLYVEIPSQNLFNAFVGQVELTPFSVNVFHHLSFQVSASILAKLRATYTDLKFKISLNVALGNTGPYLFDGLTFDGARSPRVEPPPLGGGGPITIAPAQLPPGAHAKFPSADGGDFFVTLRPVPVSSPPTVADVQTRLLAPVLRAMGFSAGTAGLITPAAAAPQRKAVFANSSGFLDLEYKKFPGYLRPHTTEMLDVFAGRTEPNEDIDDALQTGEGMTFAQYAAGIERLAIDYPFSQLGATFNGTPVPIEHTQVVLTRWDLFDVSAVRGVLFRRFHIVNSVQLTGGLCAPPPVITGVTTATDPCQAVKAARSGILAFPDVQQVPTDPFDPPHLVLLPVSTDSGGFVLRYAYRMTFLITWKGQTGPSLVWVDAQSGQILKLHTFIDNAVGAAGALFDRDPRSSTFVSTGFSTFGFRTDPADGSGNFVLSLSGTMNRVAYKGDPADPGNVAISSTTNGSTTTFANFDQAPINNSAQAICDSGTNKGFQQVNFFGSLERYFDDGNGLGVYAPFPVSPFNPKVQSASAGCNAWSTMDYGACDGYFDPACPNLPGAHMNFAHDNTVVAHEFAHNITPRFTEARPADACCPGLGCTCPVPIGWGAYHDLADAWADHWESTNCLGGWVSKNIGGTDASLYCATHDEAGGLPRVHDAPIPFNASAPGDHFPEHRLSGGNTSDYADMQIVTAALWQVRAGMRSKCRPSGIPQFGVRFARALKNTGIKGGSVARTDLGMFQTVTDLEREMIDQWATSGTAGGPPAFAHNGPHSTNKVTAGFAKVGFFFLPSQCLDGSATDPSFCPSGVNGADAVVDIIDNDTANDPTSNFVTMPINDFLKLNGNIPSFRVWTGSRFQLDAAGAATFPATLPCNARFQVDASTDPAFPAASTVSSAFITVGTTAAASAATQCFGTWTPTAAQWTSLQAGGATTRIYYRARTQSAGGGNERLSTTPGNGLWTVPPPYAVITTDGNSDY